MIFNFISIIDILRKILDWGIMWYLVYALLKNIKNNVKLSLLINGILLIIVLNWVANKVGLVVVGLVLQYIIQWGPIALIVIFQPEIRNILEQIGKTQLLGRHKTLTVDQRERLVYEIINAVDQKKKKKIGALIVLERDVSLIDYIQKATNLYAEISSELLVSIFFPNNPLHDGGVIIQGDRISCAGAVFPTSNSLKINKRLGTRHRADAISIIVSEETGRVSIAIKGELFYNLSIDDVRILLIDELRPKQEDFEDEYNEEEDI